MPATAAVLLYHTIAFWIPSLGGAFAYAMTAREPVERRVQDQFMFLSTRSATVIDHGQAP